MGRTLMALAALCALLPGLLATHVAAAEVPAVSAASAVLMDADSGRLLYAHDENQPRAIASTTKLMTALVASECLDDLSETVTIRREWTGIEGTSLYLTPGEKLTVETLLYGLLLQSGNDAAVALAAHCAGDVETFVEWMNQRAGDLGMTSSHFTDPNGLGSEDHYASALDMAKLAAACLENSTVSKIVATKSVELEGRSFINHNKLLWRCEGCIGLKTGYTRSAGRTLVSAAERDGQRLICVTLNDRDDWQDHANLYDYGFAAFPQKTLVEQGQMLRQVPVSGSLLHQIPVAAREAIRYPMKPSDQAELVFSDLPAAVQAPIQAGEIAGMVRLQVNGKPAGETYLVWGGSAGPDVRETVRSPLDWLRDRLAGEAGAEPASPAGPIRVP